MCQRQNEAVCIERQTTALSHSFSFAVFSSVCVSCSFRSSALRSSVSGFLLALGFFSIGALLPSLCCSLSCHPHGVPFLSLALSFPVPVFPSSPSGISSPLLLTLWSCLLPFCLSLSPLLRHLPFPLPAYSHDHHSLPPLLSPAQPLPAAARDGSSPGRPVLHWNCTRSCCATLREVASAGPGVAELPAAAEGIGEATVAARTAALAAAGDIPGGGGSYMEQREHTKGVETLVYEPMGRKDQKRGREGGSAQRHQRSTDTHTCAQRKTRRRQDEKANWHREISTELQPYMQPGNDRTRRLMEQVARYTKRVQTLVYHPSMRPGEDRTRRQIGPSDESSRKRL